jgi:hypothetical protein
MPRMAQKWREGTCFPFPLDNDAPPIRNHLHEPGSPTRNRFRNLLILLGKLTAHECLRWQRDCSLLTRAMRIRASSRGSPDDLFRIPNGLTDSVPKSILLLQTADVSIH